MKLSRAYLNRFLPASLARHSDDRLAEVLNQLGLAVASVTPLAPDIPNVVIARIKSFIPHPNADRLRLCQVDVGGVSALQVVCGASNFAQGDTVVFAQVGAILPGGFEIKTAKIRGQESHGMICAKNELGLEAKSEGIWNLTAQGYTTAQLQKHLGKSYLRALNLDDVIFELELTPNRGDCLSYLGVARELIAKMGAHAKKSAALAELWYEPAVKLSRHSGVILSPLPSRHPDPYSNRHPERSEGSRRDSTGSFAYAQDDGKIAQIDEVTHQDDIHLKLSCSAPDVAVFLLQVWDTPWNPDWQTPPEIKHLLTLHEIPLIHPLVDMGNFIMLESGQPIHVYDLDKVEGSLKVRLSKKGDGGKTLSGDDLKLTDQDVVIADDQKVLCVGGIIGMQTAAVEASCRRFAIEAAHFDPQRIRVSGSMLGVMTDSSYRFERGVDPTLPARALYRYAALLRKYFDIRETPLTVNIAKPRPIKPTLIKSTPDDILAPVPGASVAEAKSYLKALGFGLKGSGKQWTITIPSHRFDVSEPCDVSEEVARFYGYDKIPTHTQLNIETTKASEGEDLSRLRRWYRLSDRLVSRGYQENVHVSFLSKGQWEQNLRPMIAPSQWVCLENPINKQRDHLAPMVLPLLIEQFQKLCDQKIDIIKIFEIGRSFVAYATGDKATGDKTTVSEENRLALLCSFSDAADHTPYADSASAPRAPYREWHALAALQDIKSALEELGAEASSLRLQAPQTPVPAVFHPTLFRELWVDDLYVGFMGGLHPHHEPLKKHKSLHAVMIEINLDVFSNCESVVHPLHVPSPYPGVQRDVSLRLSRDMSYGDLLSHISRFQPEKCRRVELIDYYVEESGHLSLTLRMYYEDPEATLSDESVNKWQEKFRVSLLEQCPIQYR